VKRRRIHMTCRSPNKRRLMGRRIKQKLIGAKIFLPP